MVKTRKLQGTPLANQRRICSQLPDDIVNEILFRLPVKSLLRFRCVLKSWCSIIDDPAFQKDHADHCARLYPLLLVANNANNGANAIFSTYNNDWSLLHEYSAVISKSEQDDGEDLDEREDSDDGEDSDDREDPDDAKDDSKKSNFQLIQHCEGWICFRLLSSGSLHVCNPSTEEIYHLPVETEEGNRASEEGDLCVGFGYVASAKLFKVVRFYRRDFISEVCSSMVFTLGSRDGWRDVVEPPYFPTNVASATLLHGCLHLLSVCDATGNTDIDHFIAVFDLATEHYLRKIKLPCIYFAAKNNLDTNESKVPFQLAELGGSLLLAFELLARPVHNLYFFLLEGLPGCYMWKSKYAIDLSSVVFNPQSYNWTIPISDMGDGSILLNVCSDEKDELCCYTKETGLEKKIGFVNCSAVGYVETFLPLGVGGRHMGSREFRKKR